MSKGKKKKKTVYVDDGSSICDMSALGKGRSRNNSGYRSNKYTFGTSSRFQECFKTYIAAVKMMIKPMFITIGIITLAFLIVYLLL